MKIYIFLGFVAAFLVFILCYVALTQPAQPEQNELQLEVEDLRHRFNDLEQEFYYFRDSCDQSAIDYMDSLHTSNE